jgi:hypothetical protein
VKERNIIITHSPFGKPPQIKFVGDWPATEIIGELRYWLCYFETKIIQQHLEWERKEEKDGQPLQVKPN